MAPQSQSSELLLTNNAETLTLSVAERLLPKNLPEAGFQSYTELKNDAVAQKEAFIDGAIDTPHLRYEKFMDLSGMDKGISRLNREVDEISRIETDSEKFEIIKASLDFRAAEMEYIKLLARLDFVLNEGGTPEDAAELFEEVRLLGEQLYGKPEVDLRDAAYGEVWRQLDNKQLSPSAQELYHQLRDGMMLNGRFINGIPRPEQSNELPDFNDPSLAWAGEIILKNNADIQALVEEFWQEKVSQYGEEYSATPEDIVEALERVLALMDPEGNSGVSVILDPDATSLSWETPLMAVKVGGKRPPIKNSEMLFQKVLHELKVHGGRAINGVKSELPVLGTGLYTNTERPDYLTFEEGFATTVEEAIANNQPVWNGVNMGHYINIAQAAEGKDFREVFETAWRYRLLLSLEDNQEVTDELIQKTQQAAYAACTRIFRGTPTNSKEAYPEITPLTFNKDLAYMAGRVRAMEYIRELYANNDEAGLMRLFDAKYDPTIPEQKMIAEKYL